ncbi:helix-turn-helix domain-containing protein [Actinomadura rudentiformis]|uniref:helix-turn-helix domain-containing protein n=1 Tax=Actinomadura rudentiformis TaxID=359158 RepID=UPI001CEF5C21|nr:helix-turn-helix domain-containing protein [Actinomadura rudentiformis]
MDELRVYTPSEAARVLKIPESWLRKKAASRAIPCTFIGRHLRFSENDLTQIVRQGGRAPVRPMPPTPQ